ncbi:hypothetical protein [uncultured Amnibacterium sp.]|uniref:hypothetical protein n=1 Tax=uncultured Amnibacterium sp. TaxID=1631851 RepID=UPI0035CB036B
MNDDLPTPEGLGRIERGVQRRIDRRRQVARQIAGASVAVLLAVGGVALVRPFLVFSSGGSASSAGGGYEAGSSAGRTSTVLCHEGATTRTVEAHGTLPAAAIAACTSVARRTASSARPGDLPATPSPSATPVLCESSKGTLHVYLDDAATCATHDLLPFPG